MTTDEPRRVDLTAAAADLLRRLAGRHGPLMFHQSGGCCDGFSPMWKHTHMTVDVVPGRGGGFSVEAPDGVRFLIRSRLLTTEELEHFQLASAPMSDTKNP